MLQNELKAIEKNPKVSEKTLQTVKDLIKKYDSHYGVLGKQASANDRKLKSSLKKAMRK